MPTTYAYTRYIGSKKLQPHRKRGGLGEEEWREKRQNWGHKLKAVFQYRTSKKNSHKSRIVFWKDCNRLIMLKDS